MPKFNITGESQTRKATLKRSNEEALTFTIVSNQNDGVRHTWDGDYIERLDVDGAGTKGLNTFFKDHNRSVDSAIANVTNTRVEEGELLADVVFDESGLDVKRKYENGTLSDVSIGYKVIRHEVEEREGELPIVTIREFEITELSAVGIGFDKGAKKREFEQGENMEKLLKRLAELEKNSKRSEDENAELTKIRQQLADDKDTEVKRLAAENKELKRKAEINSIGTAYSASETLRNKFEESGTSEDFMRAILEERKAQQSNVTVKSTDSKTRADMMSAMCDAIAINAGARIAEPHKDSDMFRGASIVDIAKRVTEYSGYDKNEIASRAMVTADFPMLLVNSGNRILQQGYENATSSFELWTKPVDVQDFKTMTDITLGSGGRLSEIKENGEFKEKQLTEAGEEWKIKSFGKKFVITRQMIVNDDLGAFTNLLNEYGVMAKRTANGIVYDMLQSKGNYTSYKMKDGLAIFASGHNNIASSGTAISEITLTAARTMMMRQKSKSGDALNILPKYLIVAPEEEIIARKLIASTASTEDSKNSGVINPFMNSLQVVVDAELAAGAWYLAGDRRTIKVGYLTGTGRKPIVQVDSKSLAKTVFEGVFDFGLVAEDHRSLYKNEGV